MAVFSYLCHIEFLWSLQYRSSGIHEDQNQTDKYHDSDKASNCRNSLKNKQNNTWVDKNFPKETTAYATMFPMSSRSNPALLSKWRPNVQSVEWRVWQYCAKEILHLPEFPDRWNLVLVSGRADVQQPSSYWVGMFLVRSYKRHIRFQGNTELCRNAPTQKAQ